MEAKILTYANACDEQIHSLYESAFPKEEQIPYDDLLRLMPTMGLDFTGYYDEGEFVVRDHDTLKRGLFDTYLWLHESRKFKFFKLL